MELEKRLRDIIIFVIYRGLYRYKRFTYGINSVSEVYNKVIVDILKGCLGVASIVDDIIVFGNGVKEYDENVFRVLKKLRECGLTVNGKKCKFRMIKLIFFGYDLSVEGIFVSEEKVVLIRNA